MLNVSNIRYDFLHWFLSLEVPVQNIGISDMFHIASCGRSFPASGVAVNFQSLHGFPNGRITDDPAEFKAQLVPDLTVAHHRMVRMDVQDVAIQYLVGYLISVQLPSPFQPFVVTAAGNAVNAA